MIAGDSQNADAWNFLGFSHRNLKSYDQALDAYQKALAIDPEPRAANEYLGELDLRTGDLAKARNGSISWMTFALSAAMNSTI